MTEKTAQEVIAELERKADVTRIQAGILESKTQLIQRITHLDTDLKTRAGQVKKLADAATALELTDEVTAIRQIQDVLTSCQALIDNAKQTSGWDFSERETR